MVTRWLPQLQALYPPLTMSKKQQGGSHKSVLLVCLPPLMKERKYFPETSQHSSVSTTFSRKGGLEHESLAFSLFIVGGGQREEGFGV